MIRRLWKRLCGYFRASPACREPGVGACRMVKLMERRLREIEGEGREKTWRR